jgi:hypothetical protein
LPLYRFFKKSGAKNVKKKASKTFFNVFGTAFFEKAVKKPLNIMSLPI